MNKIWLIGRITKELSLNRTNSGRNFLHFTLAVARKYKRKDKPDTDFFSCLAWGGVADSMYQFLDKGSKVAVEGYLEKDSYQDADGNTQHTEKVIVDSIEFLETKSETIARKEKSKITQVDNYQQPLLNFEEELPF